MVLVLLAASFGGVSMQASKIESGSLMRSFILAGNAFFTIVSQKTGTRYTFHVERFSGDKPDRPWAVKVLVGPDNTAAYATIGYIFSDHNLVPKRGTTPSPSFRALDWAWSYVRDEQTPPQLDLFHAGKCGRCGRMLTDPESIQIGLGPICREKGA